MWARKNLFLIVALLSCGSLHAEGVYQPTRFGQGELRIVDSIPVVILQGTPAEIGQQHSGILAKPGAELFGFPRRMLAECGYEFLWPFAVSAGKTLMKNSPADYLQEIGGATNQAELDDDILAVANTLLELRRVGCSSLIVEPERSATGGPLFGRNFDFPAFGLLDRYGVVMVIRPTDKHAFAAVGFPGLMGVLSGMNDAGLCVATLDVEDAADGSVRFEPTGVPMMLVFRQILEECTTIAEAEALLSRTQATTRANLAVCDRNSGAVFEITPKQTLRRDSANALLPCTNHFCMPGLATDRECWRYDVLNRAQDNVTLGVSDIQSYLHQANQGELTLQTMVFEPRELVLHLSLGTPPSSGHQLHRLELKDLLSPR
ncbi:C45 family autoproteolytic acyltransferase/hydolase [Bythopirellula goksoeyrii]|uniref:Acyl-coenzyme A:6-aminopenicillanic acid acyl-transferase n=1 Tax=Bythopirellula goksoeyrii TaxID=1400387 RepID=A0A5B9Q5R4_9BACT|nr:C45 family peptidase [Bythopirellula goksoeyrii]QEG33080.1 Acyl-coenzyme A:6-aminopenicillanic acid acyl-transferase [Bythopirellula goksoeyrii]